MGSEMCIRDRLYDFELTDEEMEQIEALEKMRSMTGTKIEE